jgi:hypothetical protein
LLWLLSWRNTAAVEFVKKHCCGWVREETLLWLSSWRNIAVAEFVKEHCCGTLLWLSSWGKEFVTVVLISTSAMTASLRQHSVSCLTQVSMWTFNYGRNFHHSASKHSGKDLIHGMEKFDSKFLERNILKAVTFDLAVNDGCRQNGQTQCKKCSIHRVYSKPARVKKTYWHMNKVTAGLWEWNAVDCIVFTVRRDIQKWEHTNK